jgi:hypothetical protein
MIVIILVKERLVATIVADNKKAQFLGWAFLLKSFFSQHESAAIVLAVAL